MLNKKTFIRVSAVMLLAVVGHSALAEEIRDYYAEPGLNPFKETTQDLNESIDVFSGTLQHQYVDLMIPGNGGLDISLTRTYTSQQNSHVSDYRSYSGLGWTMHMGRIVVPTDHKDKICSQQLWSVHTQDNPSIEFADGGRELLVLKDAAVDETLITKTNWKADCQGVTQGMRVTSPSGTVYYMDVAEFARDQHSWYTSRIEDLDGNWINVSYGIGGSGIKYIDSITASDGRSVAFSYQDLSTDSIRLWKITANGQTVAYSYVPVVGGPIGAQHLVEVTRPDGLTWNYAYYPDQGLTGAGGHSMQSVEYPHGGRIEYTYQKVRFEPTSTFETTSVASKQTTGPGVTAGTWNYYFVPSTGEGVFDYTQVDGPDSITAYHHQGYVTGGSLVWPTGLLVQKVVYDLDGNPLEAITNTWSSRVISEENYWHGRTKLDNNTAAPVLTAFQHWRDGSAVTTTYSLHDAFGNPGRVDEECSLVGCANRITDKTYLNDTTRWIIGLPLVDTVDGIGSVARTYYANGRLQSIDEYGVETSYAYTSEGDLASETNARGFTRSFDSYFRGVAQTETSEVSATKSITMSRVVNPTGTVASVTDGRGFTRSFTYDALNRLTGIDFPINADVSVTYGLRNQTLTRGDYEETSSLNGFGRVVQFDRRDLLSSEIISTSTTYDALGRVKFRSYPNSALGVATEYDAIGRQTKRTHGDGTFAITEYGSFLDLTGSVYLGEVKHTDENGNVFYRLYQNYGNYQDNVGIINLISGESQTFVQRSALGEPLSIIQGKPESDGTISQAVIRSYAYGTGRFLISETHPETGVTIFGRDEVGNKISSQVGASEVTLYSYDGLNRLTQIDYPAGTVDHALDYDDNENLVSSVRGDIAWAYQYDENDNLVLEELLIGGADNRTYALEHAYDALDNLAQTTYPGNLVVDYAPDAFGRPTQAGSYATAATYHPVGVLAQVTYGNGIVTTNSLNDVQRLSQIAASALTPGDVVDLQFDYDGTGNLRRVTDAVTPANDLLLDYDANDRLVSASGQWGSGSFGYSPHGDVLTKNLGTTALAYGYGASRRLVQLNNNSNPSFTNRTTYQYDAYGNLAAKSLIVTNSLGGIVLLRDTDFRYDDAMNLLEVDDPDTAEVERRYRYDGNNYRTVAERDGSKRYSVYARSGDLVYESDTGSCEDSAYIYLGKTLIAKDVRAGTDCGGGDTTPPVVTPPAGLIVEATAVDTPVDLGTATAIDDVDGPLTPVPDQSGPFALGAHTVIWLATDAAGNTGTAVQSVTVQDTTPPVLVVPGDITVESADPIAVELGVATAGDIFTPVAITNDAPALFPLGTTAVTWQAVDANGNAATAVQIVTVNALVDTVPPVVIPPTDLVVEATGELTTVDLGAASANDDVDGPLTPIPDNAGPFALGAHVVTWQATDAAGNTGTAVQTVTVQDTTPPVLSLPADIMVNSDVPLAVDLGTPVTSDLFGPVAVANDAPALFPLGVTAVTWQATDDNGNVSVGVQQVTVVATTPLALSVSRDLPTPQTEGALYSLSATATGGSGSYEYRFEVKGPATSDSYQIVQDYSAISTLLWDTTGFVGENLFRISVRNAGTTEDPVRKWIRADVNAAGSATELAVSRDLPSPQIEGAVYQLVAEGSGGSGSYEYQFEVKGPATGDQYVVVQPFSANGTLDWNTGGFVGENLFRVSARNLGTSDAPVVRWIAAVVNPAGAADGLTVVRSLPTPQLEGAVYQLTAAGSGGGGSYEYQFEVKGPSTGDAYQLVQGFGPSDTLSWDTSGNIGEYLFRVSVRNAGSPDEPVLKWIAAGVNPTDAADGLSVTRSLPTPQIEGTVYELTAAGSGGSGDYEYLFEVMGPASAGEYEIVQDYGPAASVAWDSTGYPGANVFRVSVRNAGSDDLPVLQWVTVGVNPVGAADGLSVSRSPSSPQVEGVSYQFEAQATGGSGFYEYRFEVKSLTSNSDYRLIRDYSSDGLLVWDTTGHIGENLVRISARNAGSDHEPVIRWRRADVLGP